MTETSVDSARRRPRRVLFSAAEPSGDTHCAAVIRSLRRRLPGVAVLGVGGPKMEAAGCRLLARPVDRAVMLHGAVREIAYFYGVFRQIKRALRSETVDLVVVCDSFAFNSHVARAARRRGVRTLFYVAPQLWAWAPWRIRKLRRCCDRLCCVLPFEEDWFRSRGVDTVFVSNPLLDPVDEPLADCVKTYAGYDPQRLTLALMPGSRGHEVETLWVPMQQIALRLRQVLPQARFLAVAGSEEKRRALEAAQVPGFTCTYAIDAVRDTAKRADLTLVASGSATLEVASAGCPMLVMYRAGRWAVRLLGWLVRTDTYALVNLVAGEHVVPEFMPTFDSIDPLVATALDLAQDRPRLAAISRRLIEVIEPLARQTTHEAVVDNILGLLDEPASPEGS